MDKFFVELAKTLQPFGITYGLESVGFDELVDLFGIETRLDVGSQRQRLPELFGLLVDLALVGGIEFGPRRVLARIDFHDHYSRRGRRSRHRGHHSLPF